MRYYSIIFILSFLSSVLLPAFGQEELRNPFAFPILLSGNFGELRTNHFHAGLDFKTQGAEGKSIHMVKDGYVSRISVSPWGYGNALYVDHPDGTTTVYGHLQKFNDTLTAYIRTEQYARESFSVNLLPEPGQFPVKKDEIVALSGNSGSSGGPHLHFEIRDTQTEDILDPMDYYKAQIKDKSKPRIQGVMLYPVEGKGVINGSGKKKELKPVTAKDGMQTIVGKIEAWGDISVAVKAYDYMDGTSNIYGVRKVALSVDSQLVFKSNINRFAFDESRYLNSFVDYEEWKDKKSFYMKSFVEPGNRLRFIEGVNRGIITIDEERVYQLTYHLQDAFGNTAQLSVWIDGKKQDIPAPDTANATYFHWKSENRFGAKGVRLTIPSGNLYDDVYFRYSVKEDSTALAATHTLHNRTIPIHDKAQLSLRLQKDSLDNKQQYGIVRRQNGKYTWVGGTYRNGWLDADIRELGVYTIKQDTVPPVITPVNQTAWVGSQKITFRITDNLSGVKSYRGEIDGQYALFEYDGKKGLVSYSFDKKRLARGNHKLSFLLIDNCGNESLFEHSFVW
ncbi:hypothetical protein M2459_002204 [Parabacteroides sp. PF5-5]|uniref:M23 family metallopeptidase n=1 Tax=unclassified Parabacteroides TaxID=2649774 RepID=UPI002474A89C|nr:MULTISPECIES: M23 family metallopeptidase [unclassified Parabacteroides]MDH6305107.1 hypothetical protein [Parabacteroides sp. PH5-39]MDH6316457.1 hypothetical protein [Parabacteroides sp. PF5-13]MDH6319967.1 hypothetical protein [Parabacteroides sp. PH5-13]MDH6323800.1 hypothetical protein [Parabacteroides sp. PH5-8]MDH6327644.1 hypothetical protein [Parabacteroides sp. PH5-41]